MHFINLPCYFFFFHSIHLQSKREWNVLRASRQTFSSKGGLTYPVSKNGVILTLKSWVTSGTDIQPGIQSKKFEPGFSILNQFHSNILNYSEFPGQILVPAVTQPFWVKMTPLFLQYAHLISHFHRYKEVSNLIVGCFSASRWKNSSESMILELLKTFCTCVLLGFPSSQPPPPLTLQLLLSLLPLTHYCPRPFSHQIFEIHRKI